MASYRFIKRTSNGNEFYVTLEEGGRLREWSADSTAAEGWDGQWWSGPTKAPSPHISTRIGNYFTRFRLDGYVIVGTEKIVNTEDPTCEVSLESLDSDNHISVMNGIQGRGSR